VSDARQALGVNARRSLADMLVAYEKWGGAEPMEAEKWLEEQLARVVNFRKAGREARTGT
jgi:hypothetical protein